MSDAPLVVEVLRGQRVESRHVVDAVVVDGTGNVVDSWGETQRLVMPRSSVKPIQALCLIETGAATAFELDDVELALSCASHNGEEAHVDRVMAWMARLDLDANSFECGEQPPAYQAALIELVATGGRPGRQYNNCSGKHAGFLTVCRHMGFPLEGYINPDHPLQADYVTPALSKMCEFDLAGQEPGIDGCGIPVWQVPITNLAVGWARLNQSAAGSKLLAAMAAQPFFVAGTDRTSTELMTDPIKPVAAKAGAEGVFCGSIIDEGLGIALKARDGAFRAASVAIEHVLAHHGAVLDGSNRLFNWGGTEVGSMRVATA